MCLGREGVPKNPLRCGIRWGEGKQKRGRTKWGEEERKRGREETGKEMVREMEGIEHSNDDTHITARKCHMFVWCVARIFMTTSLLFTSLLSSSKIHGTTTCMNAFVVYGSHWRRLMPLLDDYLTMIESVFVFIQKGHSTMGMWLLCAGSHDTEHCK
jgi:hypothetical protein